MKYYMGGSPTGSRRYDGRGMYTVSTAKNWSAKQDHSKQGIQH